MKKWRCLVCSHIHEGDNPPENCPVCGAPKEQFVLVEEDKDEEVKSKELDTIETDLLVVGSGAAGLMSAITARSKGLEVLILEKAEFVGGTTARSGARYWIPNNPEQKKVGIEGKREDGVNYQLP